MVDVLVQQICMQCQEVTLRLPMAILVFLEQEQEVEVEQTLQVFLQAMVAMVFQVAEAEVIMVQQELL
jgi:hypothetical protein